MNFRRLCWVVGAGALAACLVGLVGSALADLPPDPAQHGISLTKGCDSPTQIGQPYVCTYSFRNVTDEAQDTLVVTGLTDIVHAQTGDVNSGNVLPSLRLVIGPFLPVSDAADLPGRCG